MCWNFAIINNRLGEIYYKKDKNGKVKFQGHCYVTDKEKKEMCSEEKRCIKEDIKGVKLIYRNKKYKLIKK